MKEQRKKAKDGLDADAMKEMRERYERAVEADRDNRKLAIDDVKFVTIPGHQWDDTQKKARKGRACYEFPILRSHWRQVVNDQKKSRPQIKVRATKNATTKDAELRQGLVRNIESQSNADWAYDAAFELMTAGGMGAWRVTTKYSEDDAWEQDLAVEAIPDPLGSVWMDPDCKKPDSSDAKWGFVEETLSREVFKARYPDAEAVDFKSDTAKQYGDWFGEDSVRIAEYWRLEPVTKVKLLLSDGRSVDEDEVAEGLDELAAQGITVVRSRTCRSHKVVMEIVSGAEVLEGPHETVFHRIPIVTVYANRHFIDGKWTWCGMVRFSRDPQKLLNYNLTTAQEVVSKQPKSPYLVTPKMLEGEGVKKMWDSANAIDAPYLPYTPDPTAPGNRPVREAPPDMPAAFTALTQMSVDMLKASDGIFDESQGKASNATSGRAIIARQREGDTATFDYQDALVMGKQSTGEIINYALPAIYDTPRQVRVIGKDGAEDFVQLYEEVRDQQTGQPVKVNDLSKGKYDITVSVGASYDTQRMEFVDALTQLGQGNPAIAAGVPDLIVGSMDFPKADEAAERLKLLLPPPIQQAMAQKDQSPAVMQLQGQMQQMQQVAEQHIGELQQQLQQAQQKAASRVDAEQKAANDHEKLRIDWFNAETERLKLYQSGAQHQAEMQAQHAQEATQQFNHERQFSADQFNGTEAE